MEHNRDSDPVRLVPANNSPRGLVQHDIFDMGGCVSWRFCGGRSLVTSRSRQGVAHLAGGLALHDGMAVTG